MKKWMLSLGLMVLSVTSFAQTWEEWTRQKRTQRKYLRKQIVALQAYIEFAKKGYEIAQQGLTLVGNIKDGDFKLHRDFIGALSLVNPKIKNSQKVVDIISMQLRIVRNARVTLSNVSASGRYSPDEINYCRKVFNNVLEESLVSLDQLMNVITSGELEMKDDERMKQVEKIYIEMQDKLSFSAAFSEESTILGLQRKGEAIEINRSKIINGLP